MITHHIYNQMNRYYVMVKHDLVWSFHFHCDHLESFDVAGLLNKKNV